MSFLALTHAAAQTPPAEPAPPPAPAAPAEAPGPGRFQYGVRFGPSFTTLTSVEAFDDTAEPAAFESTMNFGGFFNFALTRMLSLQPEVLFAAKGERIRDKGAPPVITASGEEKPAPADRVVLVRYLEFPILLRLSKRTHENTSFYVIAGPAFAFRRNAVIRDVADSSRYEDIEAQVNGGDLGRCRRRLAAQAVDGRRPSSSRRTEHRRRSVSGAGHDTGVLGADGGEVLGLHALGPSFADEHHGVGLWQEDDVADLDPRQVKAIKAHRKLSRQADTHWGSSFDSLRKNAASQTSRLC